MTFEIETTLLAQRIEQAGRRAALRALVRKYVEASPNSGAEDAADYLPEGYGPYDGGHKFVSRWAAVTEAVENGLGYIYPDFGTREDACAAALSDVNDDIYPERPVKVVDLDTGASYRPEVRVSAVWVREAT